MLRPFITLLGALALGWYSAQIEWRFVASDPLDGSKPKASSLLRPKASLDLVRGGANTFRRPTAIFDGVGPGDFSANEKND